MPKDVIVEPGGVYGVETVTADLFCLSCNYNLRGLVRHGQCPECGLSVPNTIIARAGTTKRELVAIAIKIAIVWTAFGSINFMSNNFIMLALWPVTLVVLALAWWKTDWIASRTVKNDGPIIFGSKIQSRAVLSIACSILGIICLLRGISSAGWALTMLFMDSNILVYGLGSLLSAALNILFGILLLIGANIIARAVLWLRTAGTKCDNQQA